MIENDKVRLRAIERGDLVQLQKWRNKDTFRRFFREYRELSFENQVQWFEKYVVNDQNTLMFAIEDVSTGELVGVNGLCYINWLSRSADLSLYIGWKDIYIDQEEDGYARKSLDLLLDYAFKTLNLNKVWTEIYEIDAPKIQLYEGMGMHLDGVLRENSFYNGRFIDSRMYSLLAREYINCEKA